MANIQKKSLADEVASRLQEQILSGAYKVNDKLPIEPELMKQFGVGRSTIREAIKTLVNSGLLRVQQGLGTFVENEHNTREPMDQRLKRANFQDLDEVRRLLEMKIAEKAATNRTEEDLVAIKVHLAERKQVSLNGALEAAIQADIAFHTAIALASKNEILADLYKSISTQVKDRFAQLYANTQVFIETQPLHEQLFKHIQSMDAKKAWNTAAKIIGHGFK